MYDILWDRETGGILLTESKSEVIRGEVRPVFFEELDLLGFNRHWSYAQVEEPLLWATPGRRYFYRGELVAEAKGGGFFEPPEIEFHEKNLHLQPVKVKTMLAKNSLLLEGLVQQTIESIWDTYKKYRPKVDAAAVAFSGGKDSLVLLDLVQRALSPGEFVVIFSDTTMEISATYDAVEKARQRWKHLYFYTARAEKDAQTTWREFGPPSRVHRWCCTVHKSVPTLLCLRELVGKPSVKALVFDGVRWEESLMRQKYSLVSEGSKHNTQINASPLLNWSSGEIFLYLFKRNIFFNRAYRYGLVRVGCAVCPLSSKWTNQITWLVFRNEVDKFLAILRDYARQKNVSENEIEKFIKEREWRVRAGGRDMDTGGTGVLETSGKKTVTFFIRRPREEWVEWAKTLGSLVREGDGRGRIENGSVGYPFRIKRHDEGVEVSLRNIDRADRFFLSHLRAAANKAAYCNHCRSCEVECPTGALQINDTVKIAEDHCIHCAACLTFVEKGCLAAKSLAISRGGTGLKGLNRYQTFGMRKAWLEEYFRDPEKWWYENSLGNRQFEAMRVWLREAEIVTGTRITLLGERLREWGTENPLTWAVIWTNLARNSILVDWYLHNVPWDSSYLKEELVELLDENLAKRSRENAITTLVGLLRDTPLGGELGLGIVQTKGKLTTITKRGWESVPALAVLYSLYRYAERVGRHGFSLSELLNGAPEGPHALFGLSRDRLAGMLRAISSRWERWLSVELVRDLDNIYLDQSRSSIEVLELGG
ncbi:phosphoadenosine phosphosulfate reductase domain-containing protein [Desulfofundulus thermocisternus]|uniref:phosphoadenosine phosphosulfate reductase domain-containing protein n=1 Tax=Desulfofundulus thermocisternus TaxID=42471 RepID=UPI000482D051|nr:phosphoadenosine phosphosulfate reductase family protein [Desulfofundulus thermocisternus]